MAQARNVIQKRDLIKARKYKLAPHFCRAITARTFLTNRRGFGGGLPQIPSHSKISPCDQPNVIIPGKLLTLPPKRASKAYDVIVRKSLKMFLSIFR